MSDTGGSTGGKVLVHRAMSLDGFIAGPEHQMDWIFDYDAPAEGEEVMAATGAMLSGRHTYEVGLRAARPETSAAYGGAWSGAEFVLTHRARTAADNPAAVFLSGDVADAVATGLAAAGGKNLEVLGTDVTMQCLARGLVDEIYVHVLPVLVGAGVPLYRSGGMAPVRLELLSSSSGGTITSMRFRVRTNGEAGSSPA
jgi:dihydrofolate reductase